MDRSIWVQSFDKDNFPSFPCPKCSTGKVIADASTVLIIEPEFSKLEHSHDAWEPEWIVQRFSLQLKCSEVKCGEVVMVSGNTSLTEIIEEDEEFGWGHSYTDALHPKMMFPSPPIINIPDITPDEVRSKIQKSFGLYWFDSSSCANALRMSVEFLLDFLKVPRTSISSTTGKTLELSLNNRIQFYEKNNPEHAETLHAMRIIGNLGSHGSEVTREALLDAYEIYEDSLADVIGGKRAYLDALKKKIIAQKGKY